MFSAISSKTTSNLQIALQFPSMDTEHCELKLSTSPDLSKHTTL